LLTNATSTTSSFRFSRGSFATATCATQSRKGTDARPTVALAMRTERQELAQPRQVRGRDRGELRTHKAKRHETEWKKEGIESAQSDQREAKRTNASFTGARATERRENKGSTRIWRAGCDEAPPKHHPWHRDRPSR
jgi:hypothetical protein